MENVIVPRLGQAEHRCPGCGSVWRFFGFAIRQVGVGEAMRRWKCGVCRKTFEVRMFEFPTRLVDRAGRWR